jgi:hypothetical protein
MTVSTLVLSFRRLNTSLSWTQTIFLPHHTSHIIKYIHFDGNHTSLDPLVFHGYYPGSPDLVGVGKLAMQTSHLLLLPCYHNNNDFDHKVVQLLQYSCLSTLYISSSTPVL